MTVSSKIILITTLAEYQTRFWIPVAERLRGAGATCSCSRSTIAARRWRRRAPFPSLTCTERDCRAARQSKTKAHSMRAPPVMVWMGRTSSSATSVSLLEFATASRWAAVHDLQQCNGIPARWPNSARTARRSWFRNSGVPLGHRDLYAARRGIRTGSSSPRSFAAGSITHSCRGFLIRWRRQPMQFPLTCVPFDETPALERARSSASVR